jgi:hypothetical protein
MMANVESSAQPVHENGNQIRWRGRAMFYRGRLYEIVIEGHLDKKWSDWLGGMEIIHEETGYTLLAGPIADQAALYGTLAKIRDLGLALISLTAMSVESDEKE